MKLEHEKKTTNKSVKMTESQANFIKSKAEAQGMNFSEYMLDCAVHENRLTPEIAVKIQEILNIVSEVYDSIDIKDYIRKEELRRKIDDLGELFYSRTPQEKYDSLTENVAKIIEGGTTLWEYLK